eukprot:CAMPEP_0174892706 /NCGR_PEP_ID=MMETSP0167-20121228/7629_1 /TAXON_ID=38298 /ORGANISM="Rhodella maculata, Strain CCMP736" /LENGTH=48 /DNA_ID= /DNA_START= /DNA_END= /DNA_ORIENTATION=
MSRATLLAARTSKSVSAGHPPFSRTAWSTSIARSASIEGGAIGRALGA